MVETHGQQQEEWSAAMLQPAKMCGRLYNRHAGTHKIGAGVPLARSGVAERLVCPGGQEPLVELLSE